MIEKDFHYKKAYKAVYLSSEDICQPTIFTIAKFEFESDKTKRTSQKLLTAYFSKADKLHGDSVPPMVVSKRNAKVIAELVGNPHVDTWINIPVTIFVDPDAKFQGETVGGLRISTERPKLEKQELTPDMPKWKNAVESVKKTGNADQVKKHMALSEENEKKLLEAANVA